MKFIWLLSCFLVCFIKPVIVGAYNSKKCRKAISEDYYDIVPLRAFIQFLVDSRTYTIVDFIQLKKDGLLPLGIPAKPLEVYPDLKKQWSNLWERVNKLRIQEERKEGVLTLIAKNKKTTLNEMVMELKTTRGVIQYVTNKLKKEGEIAYIGSPKNGYWVILENGIQPVSTDLVKQKKEEVLSLISADNEITIAQMADATETTKGIIAYAIELLKKEKKLAYMGHPRSGYWVIVENGMEPINTNPVQQRREQVLALIAENNQITAIEIAQKTDVKLQVIQNDIRQLKKTGVINRVGFGPSGYLEIPKNGMEPTSINPVKQRREQVLALIAENDQITADEIAKETNSKSETVRHDIRVLKRQNQLARIGSARSGYWKVSEKSID